MGLDFLQTSRSDPRFQLLVAAGGKHIFTRARMATENGQGQHILFNYFNINNDYYLHNLVLILQNEFTYSFQVYFSSLTQNIGL